MAKNKRLKIDMCAGSELKDTQGETLSVEGADITDLIEGRGRLNDNHGKGFFNSIGRVTEAKKIIKSEDCENDRHKYYWEKIKAPYIYVAGELYNDEDHPNAKAAAAILRNIHREDTPLVMKASVEGGVMARGVSDSSRLARTKIHSVALTFTPANNATLVEPVDLDKTAIDWEADKQLIKSVIHLAETNIPSFRHIQRHASANTIHQNINKIQELAKHLGIEVEVKTPDPETIMKNAVYHKIENNIRKINEIVKELNKANVNFMGMTSPVNKLITSPSTPTGFEHPDFINKFNNQRLADNHPERPVVARYINDLKNTPHPQGGNINHNEAERLYNALLKSDLGRAAKGVAVSIALAHGAHYINQVPDHVEHQAQSVHKELESQKQNTVKEHNSRLSGTEMNLTPKDYGFDEKEPNVPSIKVKKIKSKLKKALEDELDKALTAGYGGAGMPTDMTGGGVIQGQSLETKRKKKLKNSLKKAVLLQKSIEYITCDECGHEQVFMPHQVKCRQCRNNFSLYRLNHKK
jgi:hypothetical protein